MKVYYLNPKKLNHIEDYDPQRVEWLLKKIQDENKWTIPLSISTEHNLIMDGQHRRQVALRLKLAKVPCLIYSYSNVKLYSLRQECKVNTSIIIENFLQGKIYPYKTAKHEFPGTYSFEPVSLDQLRK
tara:strand:- start:862 stop:1245 length:384 start_codon:yes stop_codon:yes gene_type:complete